MKASLSTPVSLETISLFVNPESSKTVKFFPSEIIIFMLVSEASEDKILFVAATGVIIIFSSPSLELLSREKVGLPVSDVSSSAVIVKLPVVSPGRIVISGKY